MTQSNFAVTPATMALVQMCQENDILTPEDEFAVWPGPTGPVTIAPLFQLYDHSWLAPGTRTKTQSLEYAYRTGAVCNDEMLLHPEPYPNRESWCNARLKESERRLVALGPRRQDGARQPLATGPPADGRAAIPRVRTVVRYYQNSRLAHPISGRGRHLRPFAHSAYDPP